MLGISHIFSRSIPKISLETGLLSYLMERETETCKDSVTCPKLNSQQWSEESHTKPSNVESPYVFLPQALCDLGDIITPLAKVSF